MNLHALFPSLLVSTVVAFTHPAAAQINLLLIVTDDQAPHTLKAYGNEVCETPHLDRLAAEGMTLDGAHHMGAWAGGVCTPSRHMIMSGRTVSETSTPASAKRAAGRVESSSRSSSPPT